MALIATVVALIAPAGGCHTAACDRRVARDRCLDGHVGSCIHHAALRWHVSESMLRRKAWCESRFRPRAYNPSSGAAGLFQYLPSTWYAGRNPYRRHSPYSARWASLAAAYWHRRGWGGEWACQ